MPIEIAVVSHKGGSGKTAVALNLGAELAAMRRRVLLVDVDPQGALTAGLGVSNEKPGLYELITNRSALSEVVKSTGVDRLALISADKDVAGLEVELPQAKTGDWPRIAQSRGAPVFRLRLHHPG